MICSSKPVFTQYIHNFDLGDGISPACVVLFKDLFAGLAAQLQKTIDHCRILWIDIVAIQKQQVMMFDLL